MYNLINFTQEDMYRCAIDLRSTYADADNMEEVAERIVRYLYNNCVDPQTGESACALVRLFKTHPYKNLPIELQIAALDLLKVDSIADETKCLTLMATAGDEPHWNTRDGSSGHKAIPLLSVDFVSKIPMISRLIQQFGLEIDTVLEPMPDLLIHSERKIHSTFIFHVPTALGSQYIPAQKDFVVPYQVKSVLGFGGLLPSGNLFVIIMFTKTWVPQETATLFKWVSTYTWLALTAFDGKAVFANLM
ncbi:hypothetical protein [Leptolyngbya sp. GB1-A1]|uniref:hypothetical protein n=1 Tax=unclassified Leptolyngbya TaxID=2650499 RepID=UPI0032975137